MLFRGIAAAIAVLGAIDPPVSSERRVRPEIALLDSRHATDAAASNRVARALDGDFVVIRGPFAAAAATVAVGATVPAHAAALTAPAFAVAPERTGPALTIESIIAPRSLHVDARAPVIVRVRATGASGAELAVSLRRDGIVVDRVAVPVDGDDVRKDLRLSLAAPASFLDPRIRVTATIDRPAVTVHADAAVATRPGRARVLFHDGRPSWLSTFVRRAVGTDPRLAVTSRVGTSRGAAILTGDPPAGLGDAAALSAFETIVIGAPDTLTARDLETLDAVLRTRAATVVLLLDHEEAATVVDRLLGPRGWTTAMHDAPVTLSAVDSESGSLRATELLTPRAVPPGARVLIALPGRGAAVVWQAAAGAGRVIVSGALDAWRFREADAHAFDRFWRDTIGNAAETPAAPVELVVTPDVVRPGRLVHARVWVRNVALDPSAQPPAAGFAVPAMRIGSGPEATVVRVAPGPQAGQFDAEFSAPPVPGTHVVRIESDYGNAVAPLVVAEDAEGPQPDERALLDAWTASRGGRVVSDGQLDDLRRALDAAISPPSERITWHPMRSPWWMVPFAACLAIAWARREAQGSRLKAQGSGRRQAVSLSREP
jgi:hypothetical protein